MKRTVLIKIGGEARSVSPAALQWAGMQYEDNATEVVFDLSALEIQNALYRIDFNSVTAGYFPSENLIPDGIPSIRRSIPKYITQYGGELEAVAVITPLDSSDEPVGEVLSYPVKLYFTEVSRGDEGEAEFIPSLSAIEESVRKMKEEVADDAEAVEEARLAVEQTGAEVSDLLRTKANLEFVAELEADKLYYNGTNPAPIDGEHIYQVVSVCNGDHVVFDTGLTLFTDLELSVGHSYLIASYLDHETGWKFSSAFEVCDLKNKVNSFDILQSLDPESEKPISSKAVAEAVGSKANLEYKELPIDIFGAAETGIEGEGVYTLNEFYPVLETDEGTIYSLVFDDSAVRLAANLPVASPEYFEKLGYTVGKKYLISMLLNQYGDPTVVGSVSAVIDLSDKLGRDELPEAIATLGAGRGEFTVIADITTTEEVNGIIATSDEYEDISKCKEFICRVILPKTETVLTLGSARFFINNVIAFRLNSVSTSTSGLNEMRCHSIIADTLLHTIGVDTARGHGNVVGNANILVGNNAVTELPQEISFSLNDNTKLLPIGTQYVIYGRVER